MFALAARADPYPQRRDWREIPWLDRAGERLRLMLFGRRRVSSARLAAFAAAVEAAQARVDALDASGREQSLRAVRARLRRDGFAPNVVADAFALVRRAAGEILGLRHFPTQIKGGYILLQGFIAEMDTGEGKTLTATLAVITAALAGWPVQVVTVNDYLAQRDAETLRPLYAAFGLSTGLALETLRPEEKRREYGADITYCTSKTLVFDYLRDRVALGERMRPLGMALSRLSGEAGAQIMLRGLHFTVVDEADSVFVDEARVPLIISVARQDAVAEAYFRQAVALAQDLHQPEDFRLQEAGRRPELTERGRRRLAEACAALTGLWTGALRREEAVLQALSALHGFQRDVHYIVRDGKVMIVDEHTGRVMPDRSWERGLQQMIEVKEDVAISPEKETLARISFQLFFRRYLRLAGMTGTAREVAGELGEVYGLGVVRVPPHRPSRRSSLPPRLYASAGQRWQAVIAAVRERHQAGQPVLVGTRSILASEHLSALLTAEGVVHQVLNAKQDGENGNHHHQLDQSEARLLVHGRPVAG